MKESMWDKLLNKSLSLRERSFRAILLIGVVTSFFTVVEGFSLNSSSESNFVLLLLLGVLCLALFMTFKLNMIKTSMYMVGLFLAILILPLTYVYSGGSAGGAGIWLTMGLAYGFVFFTGKSLVIFSVIAIIADAVVVGFGYVHPERIHEIDTVAYTHFDIFFSAVLVGLFFGAILKFQSKVYDQERDLVLSQKEELERVNDSKIKFFSDMSHELREPINNIIALNELLLRENLSDEAIKRINDIDLQSRYLLSFVNDIYDCARLESNKIELVQEEYDTLSMVTNIVDIVSSQAKAKGIEFNVKVDSRLPKRLIGDARRLEQIFLNLLITSLQNTKKGTINFEIACEDLGTEWTCLNVKVSDTGVGIRKDDIPFIFDSFKQVEMDKSGSIEGVGIGLTICKQLIDLMGGNIFVDSIYTKGTSFTIKIEQRVVNPEEIGTLNNYRKKDGGKSIYRHSFEASEARILVVDSNEMNLMIFKKFLRETKLQIDICSSSSDALGMTNKTFYNLIFVDYRMPEMNGVELLSRIRKQESGVNKDTPVIALVSDELRGKENSYIDLGFSSFLHKPIVGNKLEDRILQFIPDDLVDYRREAAAGEGYIIHGKSILKKKMMITTDVVSDISAELANSLGVKVLHLYIKTENGRFCDNTELGSKNYSVFSPDQLIKASMDSASVEEYEDFFADALTEAEEVIHISLSSTAGKSYQIAMQAAKGFDHVHVVDASQISCAQGLLVTYASRLLKTGKKRTEIIEEINEVKNNIYSSFVTIDAEQLYRMGYTSKMTHDLLSFSGMHPKVQLVSGCPRIKGFISADFENLYKKFVTSEFKNRGKINTSILYISYAGVPERELDALVIMIKQIIPFERIVVCSASATNTCGAGIGTFGFAYFIK